MTWAGISCDITRMPAPSPEAPGLAARRLAAEILEAVLRRRRPFDEQLDDAEPRLAALPERDRALTRALVATVLRRLGTLRHLLGLFLERGTPAEAPRVETALLLGAAQILLLDVPDHAAVDLSVRLVRSDRRAARYAGLVNAVLRRLAQRGAARLQALDTITLDTPAWLMARWTRTYGAEAARMLAQAGARVVAVDRTEARLARLRQNLARLKLAAETVAADAAQWQAGPFDAVLLDAPCSSTGTIRRHPDIPWLKREDDIGTLTALQRSLVGHAAELVRPGGLLVYCTCSLEPEECEAIVGNLLAGNSQ